ncbi:MAG: 30S ribosomal protein S7, partial [Kiritimatiellales bacterium]
MARRRKAEKRTITPDPRFNNELLAYMINSIMGRGKKSIAAAIVYGALEDIQQKLKEEDPLVVFA